MKQKDDFSRSTWLLLGVAMLLVAGTGGIWLGLRFVPPSATEAMVMDRPERRDFSLTGTNGEKVSLAAFEGKWVLMFFGFTMCPEVCPLAMQTVGATLEEMGEVKNTIQPVFVTIDPERDTSAVLKDYLAHFDGGIVGLSGTAEETASIARAYGVFYRKRPIEGDYTMDHSTALYLIAPDGRFVRPFRADVEPVDLAKDVLEAMTSGK